MAVQNEEKFVTVVVYDGEIELKSPRFGDYIDMYIAGDNGDDEETTAVLGSSLTREKFLDLAAKLIVRWSYPEPVTKESIAALDAKASVKLIGAINELLGAGIEDRAQAKKVITV